MDQNPQSQYQSQSHSHSLSQDLQDNIDNDLPTYHELAAQQGPNSRFGRWKGWVEKRAAERYAEDTPEKQLARKLKGWGPHVVVEQPTESSSKDLLESHNTTLSRTRTVLSSFVADGSERVPTDFISTSQCLPPSHLRLHTFGSRFLPHSEHPILCLLPICDDTKLLIGHADGLSVLDMYPEVVSSELGPREPRRRDIFHGESIFQLELLEYEQSSTMTTPKGVVLALVGTDHPEGGSDKDGKEVHKAIRMYNLASLVSAARWASSRKDREALDMRQLCGQSPLQQSCTKKHKSRDSKSKPHIGEGNGPSHSQTLSLTHPTTPPRDFSDDTHSPVQRQSPLRNEFDGDVFGRDELPLRWVMDYVPLATSGSRLVSQSVHFFELHRSSEHSRVTTRLAVATKQNILLYETVRGERAFRFVKEFYTPIPARSITFLNQSQQGPGSGVRSPVSATLSPYSASIPARDISSRRASTPSPLTSLFHSSPSIGQFSLFVIFDKKAGIIRISDSSVGEIDLWEEPRHSRRASSHSPTSPTPFRLPISSFDNLSIAKDTKGLWIPPAEVTIPSNWVIQTFTHSTSTMTLYLLTRGKYTHIVWSPLPLPVASHTPLKILQWNAQPTRIVPRACQRPITGQPFLQVMALGDLGVEVQEFPLSSIFLTEDRGEEQDAIAMQAEVGSGGAGFLCMGGHWTERERQANQEGTSQRHGSSSTADTVDLAEKRSREQGFYAWTQKGYNDWRVFWLGGSADDGPPPASP
ncbi:hypothetical protein BU17DRAFT_79995 [Hysterangium stoloniferum]|nr:hypothetical protein BU17DRAFT_79995 [Hysterangium stoloniferum]